MMVVHRLKLTQYVNQSKKKKDQGLLPTSGIQQCVGCTPAVVEGSQFMGTVVSEEAEYVSGHLRHLCDCVLLHISVKL